MEKISVEEFRKLNKRGNKYNAKKTEYNGRMFDSKKEADFAKHLQYLRHARKQEERVVVIEYQIPFPVYVKNQYVFTYIADFRVRYADKHETVFDVKGTKVGAAYAMFRLKKKCVEAFYHIIIEEI